MRSTIISHLPSHRAPTADFVRVAGLRATAVAAIGKEESYRAP